MPERTTRTVVCAFWMGGSFGQEILAGVCRFAREQTDWTILQLDIRDDKDLEGVDDAAIAGVLVQPFNERHLAWVHALGKPAVAVNQRFPHKVLPVVCSDEREAGRMAAEFLLRRGYRNFAYAGRSGHPSSDRRAEGFVERLAAAGYRSELFSPEFTFSGRQYNSQYIQQARSWVSTLPRPVAIFCFVDVMAANVIDACLFEGLRVPEDAAVLGVGNDTAGQELAKRSLSSVALASREVGYRAAELLNGLLDGQSPPANPVVVPPLKINERQSTDLLAINDPVARRALGFIRENLHRPITSAELARAAGISRRPLEKRFRRLLGTSPSAEITHLRVERAKDLLISTTFKIEQVATACGFEDGHHLAIVFKRAVGITPREFRLRNAGVR
jgi:LacI family transcriptional regulator